MRTNHFALFLGLSAAAAGGCSDNRSNGGADAAACDGPCDAGVKPDLATASADLLGSQHYRFVLSSVLMPDSSDESTKYLYDIDGSGINNGQGANKLLAVVDALRLAGGISLQTTVDNSLAQGTLVELLDVVSSDSTLQNDNAITVSGYVGKTAADPVKLFSGTGTAEIDPSNNPANHTVQGTITTGKADTLHLPPGAFPIQFPLETISPVPLVLHGIHAQFQVKNGPKLGAGLTYQAMLNGGLSKQDIDTKLVPAVAQMINNFIQQDPNGQNAQALKQNFDTDRNGTVTVDEVADNFLVKSILEPDLDLFDANGNLAPNQDKVKDSLSFGVGFTAVPVSFTPPGN